MVVKIIYIFGANDITDMQNNKLLQEA